MLVHVQPFPVLVEDHGQLDLTRTGLHATLGLGSAENRHVVHFPLEVGSRTLRHLVLELFEIIDFSGDDRRGLLFRLFQVDVVRLGERFLWKGLRRLQVALREDPGQLVVHPFHFFVNDLAPCDILGVRQGLHEILVRNDLQLELRERVVAVAGGSRGLPEHLQHRITGDRLFHPLVDFLHDPFQLFGRKVLPAVRVLAGDLRVHIRP